MSNSERSLGTWISKSLSGFPHVVCGGKMVAEVVGKGTTITEDVANCDLIAIAVNAYEANQALISRLTEALEECAEYFDNKADAYTEDGVWVQNKEMRLLSVCDEALARAERAQKEQRI